MTEKLKLDKVSLPSISRLNFFLLWLSITIATTYFAAGIAHWLMSFSFIEQFFSGEIWQLALASSLLVGGSVAIVQKRVLRVAFGFSFDGWIWASVFGIILGNLPLSLLYLFNFQNFFLYQIEPYSSLIHLLVAILVVLPQAWILRRYVQMPWLFVLSNVFGTFFSGLMMSSFIANGNFSDFASLSVVALRSALPALTMLWFFRAMYQPKKVTAKSQSEDHKRLEDGLSENSLGNEQGLRLKEANETL
jgi:hypothetical protein